MEKWFVKNQKPIEPVMERAKKFGVSPVMMKIMANRGVRTDEDIREYLFGTEADIPDSRLLKDMDKATDIILSAVSNGKKIRIMGDYDVDGVTSTFIFFTAIKELGGDVSWFIPHRVKDGYGLHLPAIEEAKDDGIDVIITCDNGISCADVIAKANEYGMTVVLTDHHDIPYNTLENGEKEYIIPDAAAVIDPHLPDSEYPFESICGAEVAYKVSKELYRKLGKEEEFDALGLIAFAALGTVCDVMPLIKENRILVKKGLKAIHETKNVGLRQLLKAWALEDAELTAYDLGFKIGPTLNAAGRLEAAAEAEELFTETDEKRAEAKAKYLFELNQERQKLCKEGTAEAFKIVDAEMQSDKVLVVYLPDTHESVAGIIAGKVREKYNKPSFVVTDSDTEGVLKGSGRSIPAYHMSDELGRVKDTLIGFGGHPMAAGLSLRKESLDVFRQRLNELTTLTEDDFIDKRFIDVVYPMEMLNVSFIESMKQLEPFGNGNEKPVFAQRHLMAVDKKIIGKNRNVLKLTMPSGNCRDAVMFGDIENADRLLTREKMTDFAAIYSPSVNEWNGNKTAQAIIVSIQ